MMGLEAHVTPARAEDSILVRGAVPTLVPAGVPTPDRVAVPTLVPAGALIPDRVGVLTPDRVADVIADLAVTIATNGIVQIPIANLTDQLFSGECILSA